MKSVLIQNQTTFSHRLLYAQVCDSFFSRFRGLMFRKALGEDQGILLVEGSDSRINTSIHMFFMAFDIGVVWIDSGNSVVDTTIAKPWKPYYAPRTPARYTLEIHPVQLEHFHIGDKIEFSNVEK